MAKPKTSTKRRTTKKPPMKTKKTAGTAQLVPAKVVVRVNEDTPDYYINYAEVASSLNEFSLYGARVPTKLSAFELEELQKSGQIAVEPLVQLTMPITIINGLINALKTQMALYEDQFGKFTAKGEEK